MKRFLAAVRFLTIFPVPGTWGTAEEDLARSVPLFPVVGLLLGVVAAGVAWSLSFVAPPLVAAAAVVIVLVAFSGGLHMDGLSDTADGFLSSRPRERVLEIMRDSHIGAMGVIAIVCVLLVKFAAMASLRPSSLVASALLAPLAGRCAMVLHMAVLDYVRPQGLGSVFYRAKPRASAVWAVVVLAAAGWFVLGGDGLILAGVCIAVALALAAYARRRIGGATGDTLGAACEIVEIVPALTLALWPMHVVAR